MDRLVVEMQYINL